MSRFILSGFETEELENTIKDSPVFPLIRDICFKFGLKVLCQAPIDSHRNWFQLCLPNGMAVGKVFTRTDEDGLAYCYRSPYYRKERGRNEADKETIHSKKVATLISTLKRVGAVPDLQTMLDKKMSKLGDAIETMQSSIGSSYKPIELTSNEIHALLCAFLGESPNGSHLTIDTDRCKKILDKYNLIDSITEKKKQEVTRLFTNPFYMIGVDEFNHFIVGKVKILGEKQYEIIEQFKRYKDINEYEDLIPLMTMTKVAYEGKGHTMQGGCVPVTDKYDESLDAVFCYSGKPTHYDYVWMITPC